MQNKFAGLIRKYKISLKKYTTIFSAVGYLKLLLIAILGISLYLTFIKDMSFNLVSVIAFALLIFLWIYHIKLHEKINYLNGLITINNQHLSRISGKWTDFEDIGAEFIDSEHAYAGDLDIVGNKSLFQFLNTTKTWHGRQAFANDLLHPAYTNNELKERQEAIFELSKDIEFSSRMIYYLSKIGADNSTPKLINELKNKNIIVKHKTLKIVLTYLPLVTFIFITGMFIFHLKSLYLTGAALVLLQAIIWIAGITKTQNYLGIIAHLPYKLSSYSTVIEILKNKEFTSEKLIQIQSQLSTSNLSAAQAIKDLVKISDRISARNNAIINFILNVLFLWDYQCSFMLEEWKAKYANLSESWFIALGEFESLLSFSNLPNICAKTCLPIIASTHKTFEANGIGHPLLSNEIRVYNNFTFGDNILIISGSNMSGKTTFLRTVGINLVLAQAGSFVCAGQLIFSPLKMITSMRIADDLNEGVSTFYAELKRIKTIIEAAKSEPNTFFLIDEIFRGTNSVDRLSGAKTIISKLNELDTIGIITTHDLELCDLANQHNRIKNYSFSEYYEENRICFNYKIRFGKSNTTNAKYLMEMVGIT